MLWKIIRKLAPVSPRGKCLICVISSLMVLLSLSACSGLLSPKNGNPSYSMNCYPNASGGTPANRSSVPMRIKPPIPNSSGMVFLQRKRRPDSMLSDVTRITSFDLRDSFAAPN